MAKKSNVTPIADGRIQPQLLSVAFKHAKETTNAHRFEELDDSGKPVTDRKAARFNYGVV